MSGLAVPIAISVGWLSLASVQAWETTLDFSDSAGDLGWQTEAVAAGIPLDDEVRSGHWDDSGFACDAPGHGFGNRGISYAPGHPGKPRRDQPGDIDRGACPPYRYTLADCDRAGRPHRVAWWAAPSVDQTYSAWFVGGGAAIGGRSKLPSEGTWGMDYHGRLPYRRVWLKWTHGRSQGGEGAYQSDGHTGPMSRH